MSCTGDGICLQQCTHRAHNGYCPSTCRYNCKPVECHNFQLCGQKRPQRLLDSHNGMCMDCAINYGKMTTTNEIKECVICMEQKTMVQLSCQRHSTCITCWKRICDTTQSYPARCPLCREGIWR